MKKSVITRDDGVPYLIRYNVFNWGFISLKFHKIIASDDDCLHDHPWAFLSIILRGGYYEHSPWVQPTKVLKPDRPCWTMVFTFKRVREWGFFTRFGWIHWLEYSSKGHCE